MGLVRVGGGGIVIQVHRALRGSKNRIDYALKIARPSLFKPEKSMGEAMREQGRTNLEFIKHAPLSHRNICHVFEAEILEIPTEEEGAAVFPCMGMLLEWIRKPSPLSECLCDSGRALDHVALINLLVQCFDGLEALHANGLIHWDMKSDNVLVDADGIVKITDLGNARHSAGENDTLAQSTIWNLPKEVRELVKPVPTKDFASKRTEVEVGRKSKYDHPWLDMWMLAYELNRLFLAEVGLTEVKYRHELDPFKEGRAEAFLRLRFPHRDENAQFALECVRLVLRRLLRPCHPADEPYYKAAAEVAQDLRKLTPEFGAAQNIPEMRAMPQHVLRLPGTRNGIFTPRISEFFNSPLMVRVSGHLQLSTLKHVYPGAEHKRSEHIAGVLNTTVQYVRALYADRTNPFWRLTIEQDDIEALFFAALCHDIGHLAFGHYLEEMRAFFDGRLHENYAVSLLDSTHTTKFGPSTLKTATRDRQILRSMVQRGWAAGESVDDFLVNVARILMPELESGREAAEAEAEKAVLDQTGELKRATTKVLKRQILHSIINSAIDADKLDYLLRDALHCGVQYASGIDLDRFFQALTTLSYLPPEIARRDSPTFRSSVTARHSACIAVTEKGILPVEGMLVARYQMFTSVYWHHTARAESAILQFLTERFVGTASSENQARQRLDILIETFREKDDAQALAWLTQKLKSADLKMSNAEREVVQHACDALRGDRKQLYWRAFDLKYEGPGQVGKGAVQIFDKLLDYFDPEKYVPSLVGTARRHSALRAQFANNLLGKFQDLKVIIEDGELLIDVPPRGKDQIKNVYVWMGDATKTVQESSPIAEAVGDTFRYWSRRIRVFLAPRVWNAFADAGISEEAVRAQCFLVMRELPDHDFFHWQDGKRRVVKTTRSAKATPVRPRRPALKSSKRSSTVRASRASVK
jgi:HD superfamily phosphohydrolase